MNKEPIWLRRDAVIAMHKVQIAEHGGKPGVRDSKALDTALARPAEFHAGSHPPLPDLAANYASSLLRKLPFLDGNKRIAFVCALTFLRLNGLHFNGTAGESASLMMRLAKGRACENDLAEFLRRQVTPWQKKTKAKR